jgi:hypothetical protein
MNCSIVYVTISTDFFWLHGSQCLKLDSTKWNKKGGLTLSLNCRHTEHNLIYMLQLVKIKSNVSYTYLLVEERYPSE